MPTLERTPHITILVTDHEIEKLIRPTSSIKIIKKPDPLEVDPGDNVLVFSTESQLNHVAGFVRAMNQKHRLRAFLIREEYDPKWLAVQIVGNCTELVPGSAATRSELTTKTLGCEANS